MGILNITPDSFSDGGKYYQNNLAKKQLDYLFKCGADLVDIGGESTRPGSKSISSSVEWNRIKYILKKINKNKLISLDTRKSDIMEKGIKLGVGLINDVSGLSYDANTLKTEDAWIVDFQGGIKLDKLGMSGARAFVNIDNLLDKTYLASAHEYGVRPNKPQTFMVGMQIDF